MLNIVITGASASGKTTLCRNLRKEYDDSRDVVVARRLVTRPPRLVEDPAENEFLSVEQLLERHRFGVVPFVWPRRLPGGTEWYGFSKPQSGALVTVFPGNTALFERMQSFGAAFPGKQRIIYLDCDDVERRRRLDARSPEMADREREYRLAPAVYPGTHIRADILKSLDPSVPLALVRGLVQQELDGMLGAEVLGSARSA